MTAGQWVAEPSEGPIRSQSFQGIDVARHLERATDLIRLLVAIVKTTRATT